MQSRRLIRLIRIVLDIKFQPYHTRRQYLESLKIRRSQFYADRDFLNQIGFEFSYSKSQEGFVLKKDPVFDTVGLSLSQLLALILAVREQVLGSKQDFAAAYGAYEAVRTITNRLPLETRKQLSAVLETVVVRDGFACKKSILDALQGAIMTRNRVVIHYQKKNEKPSRRYTADPQKLCFNKGNLVLTAFAVETGKVEDFQVSLIKRAAVTPFIIPGS